MRSETAAPGDASRAQDRPAALLEVARLTKSYGDQTALTGLSFDVRAGEILGIIGPNGAGKTTLMEALAGLIAVDDGEVLWSGMPLAASRRRDVMFYLPDAIRPYVDQHVVRVLAFFAGVYRRSAAEVAEAIAAMGIAPVLAKRVGALSKGYCRRLMLGLALLTRHPLLLLDEPFDGFDLRQTREIMGLMRRIAGSGRTLVLSIHQLADAERVCDRFVLLRGGELRGIGTLDELRQRSGRPAGSLEEVFLALT
jgi:ABC-type multidrug transport system ATPase subunit